MFSRPFGPLDFVLRALRALRPGDPRNDVVIGQCHWHIAYFRRQIQKISSTNPKKLLTNSKKIIDKSNKFRRQIQKKLSRNAQIQKSKISYFLENPVVLTPADLPQIFPLPRYSQKSKKVQKSKNQEIQKSKT